MANYETFKNSRKTIVFNKSVPAGESGFIDSRLVAHGEVESVRINFAVGENGTLHIRPVVIIPGEIMIDLFGYADNSDQYVSGDNETVESGVGIEIENDTILRIFYDNIGEEGTADSELNVKVTVNYFETVDIENIIGPRRQIGGIY